jgi:hypothetical protein
MTRMTIITEEGQFISVRLGRKDVTSDFAVVDMAHNFQCERCLRWWPMAQACIEYEYGPLLCPECYESTVNSRKE